MSSKKLLPIAAIAIIAILIMIVSENLSKKRPAESTLKFFNEKIGSFIIKNSSGTVTLHKSGDLWVVSRGAKNATAVSSPVGSKQNTGSPDLPTDSANVVIALEKLAAMKKGDKVSANAEKQAIFEVDTIKGTSIEVFNTTGKSLGTFLIGKSTPDNNGNFVRMIGSNDVYTVGGNIGDAFFTDITRWRNKMILNFDKSLVTSLTLVKKDGKTISMTKADSGNVWNIVAPEKAPAKFDQVDGILEALSRYSTSNFQDTAIADTVSGFNKPELAVTFGLKAGSKKIIFGAKRPDNKIYAIVDGNEQIYLVNDFEVASFNKDIKDLKDTVPSVPAPKAKPAADKK